MTKAHLVKWIVGALVTLACAVAGTALCIHFVQTGECSPDVHAVVIAAHVHEGNTYSVQIVTTEFMEKAPIVALYEGEEPANGCEALPRSSLATYTFDEDAGWFDIETVVVRSLHRLERVHRQAALEPARYPAAPGSASHHIACAVAMDSASGLPGG